MGDLTKTACDCYCCDLCPCTMRHPRCIQNIDFNFKKKKKNFILLNVNNVIVLFGIKEEREEVLVENNKVDFYFQKGKECYVSYSMQL